MSTTLTGEPQPKANGKDTHSEKRRVGDTVAPPIPDWRHPQAALPSRPREFHPEPLTDSVREPLDSYGSCHRAKAAAFR